MTNETETDTPPDASVEPHSEDNGEAGASVAAPGDETAGSQGSLSPALEAILEKVGWSAVKELDPSVAASCVQLISWVKGGFITDPVSARATLKRFRKLTKDIERILEVLNSLPQREAWYLNMRSKIASTPEGAVDEENWPGHHVETTAEALGLLRHSLTEPYEWFEWQSKVQATGRSRNRAAYMVAHAVAQVYVVGLGKRPTYGRGGTKNAPTGEFAHVVVEVFRELGLAVGDPVEQCETACKGLDPTWVERALRYRHGGDR